CPCSLRWGAGADAAGGGVIVRGTGFSPAAVGVLHHAQPFGALLDAGFVVVHADGFEAAQDQRGAVDIVDAPASEPTAIRFLLFADELDGALYGGMVLVVAISRHHF